MTVDHTTKIHVGDDVHILCQVTALPAEPSYSFTVLPVDGGPAINIHREAIVSHHPAELKAGDRVRATVGTTAGIIVAVREGVAWVVPEHASPGDSGTLFLLDHLARAS